MQETAQQYIQRILGHVEGQDAIKVQRTTAAKLKKLTHGLTPKQLKWKPEPGKWSIAEIVAHLADAEIVASWRMRSVLGSEWHQPSSPSTRMSWASVFQYGKRDAKQSLEVFRVLRENNLAMLKALPRETLGQLRHAPGARQGNHCASGPHVCRARYEPRAADRKHRRAAEEARSRRKKKTKEEVAVQPISRRGGNQQNPPSSAPRRKAPATRIRPRAPCARCLPRSRRATIC